jgi:uncharacterized surface anchored protein
MAMEGLDIYLFADNTLADLKQAGKTDANGIVTFNLPASENYAFTIQGAPKGYEVSPSYSFSNGTAIVSLNTALITEEDITSAKLGVGDVMYDFTVNTVDGKEIKLSDIETEEGEMSEAAKAAAIMTLRLPNNSMRMMLGYMLNSIEGVTYVEEL